MGVILIKKNKITKGILTDGDLKRLNRKFEDFQKLEIKKVMKKNPISVNKDTLAAQALSIMNEKKITSLCIHHGKQKNKTIGIIHIHNILGLKYYVYELFQLFCFFVFHDEYIN